MSRVLGTVLEQNTKSHKRTGQINLVRPAAACHRNAAYSNPTAKLQACTHRTCQTDCSPCSGRQPVFSVWMLRAEDRSQTRAVPSVDPVTTNRAQGSIARAVMAPVWPAVGGLVRGVGSW